MSEHALEGLPADAPDDPLPLACRWLGDAEALGRRNPLAIALATTDARGRPSVRMVLMRGFDVQAGYAVFYTNYGSRKARQLDANGRAAAVLYWEELGRQLRLEGAVRRSPPEESDRYFAGRPWQSQLNAWASEQSRPLPDSLDLAARAALIARDFGFDAAGAGPDRPLPRPAHWGGFRLWLDSIEFWVEGAARFHERLRYTRALETDGATVRVGPWASARLQP